MIKGTPDNTIPLSRVQDHSPELAEARKRQIASLWRARRHGLMVSLFCAAPQRSAAVNNPSSRSFLGCFWRDLGPLSTPAPRVGRLHLWACRGRSASRVAWSELQRQGLGLSVARPRGDGSLFVRPNHGQGADVACWEGRLRSSTRGGAEQRRGGG